MGRRITGATGALGWLTLWSGATSHAMPSEVVGAGPVGCPPLVPRCSTVGFPVRLLSYVVQQTPHIKLTYRVLFCFILHFLWTHGLVLYQQSCLRCENFKEKSLKKHLHCELLMNVTCGYSPMNLLFSQANAQNSCNLSWWRLVFTNTITFHWQWLPHVTVQSWAERQT